MANGHGGARIGSGRPRVRQSHKHEPDKLQPIELALSIMRDVKRSMPERIEALKIAIPYCSARLQQTSLDVEGDLIVQLVSHLDDIDPDPKPKAA